MIDFNNDKLLGFFFFVLALWTVVNLLIFSASAFTQISSNPFLHRNFICTLHTRIHDTSHCRLLGQTINFSSSKNNKMETSTNSVQQRKQYWTNDVSFFLFIFLSLLLFRFARSSGSFVRALFLSLFISVVYLFQQYNRHFFFSLVVQITCKYINTYATL